MTTAVRQHHVAGNRIVFTYQPEDARWPEGVLTGYGDVQGGFVLEHVLAFRAGVVLAMLRAGLAEASARGYRYVTFGIPDDFPKARALGRAAERVGCAIYEQRDGWTYWVHYLDR